MSTNSMDEEYLRKVYEAEVEKRLFFENQCQIQEVNKEHEKEKERYKQMYTDAVHLIDFLRSFKGANTMNLKEFLAAKKSYKKESKALLKNEKAYWEPIFDAKYYAGNNPDVQMITGDDEDKLLKHFVCRGMAEGRRGSEGFDVYDYIKYNPDILTPDKKDFRDLYLHYITQGKKEGRKAVQDWT